MRYSSCVTSAPLNLLVTALDGRCDAVVRCIVLLSCCLLDLVMLRSNSVQSLFASSVYRLVCYRGYRRRRCEFVRSNSPSASSSHQVRGSIYHAYNFQLTVPSSRIDRLLDTTTSYLCLRYKPQTAMSLHIPANHVLLCYYCSLLSPCLVCMLGCYLLFLCYSFDWGIIIIIIVVDDMIIIMLTIFDEGWKV